MNALSPITAAPVFELVNWRDYVAHVRGDAIELTSPEVTVYMDEGGYTDRAQALADYRHDACFLCPVLGRYFHHEDGVEGSDGVWRHIDARLIGHEDNDFNYGRDQ